MCLEIAFLLKKNNTFVYAQEKVSKELENTINNR